jgi:hypothetical protein
VARGSANGGQGGRVPVNPRRIFLFDAPWAIVIGVGAGIVTSPESNVAPPSTSVRYDVELGGGPPMTTSGMLPPTRCDRLLLRAQELAARNERLNI